MKMCLQNCIVFRHAIYLNTFYKTKMIFYHIVYQNHIKYFSRNALYVMSGLFTLRLFSQTRKSLSFQYFQNIRQKTSLNILLRNEMVCNKSITPNVLSLHYMSTIFPWQPYKHTYMHTNMLRTKCEQ